MSKRVLTKLSGSINAFLFLGLGFITFFLAIFSALTSFGIAGVGKFNIDFITENFSFYYNLIPLDMGLSVAIVLGVVAILCLFYMLSSKRLLKIANREIVGVYKKRKSIGLKIFFLWIFAGIMFTGVTIPNTTLKIICIVIGSWLIVSTVLLIIDKSKVKKEYMALKAKLENAEKTTSLGQKVDTASSPITTENLSSDIGISNDRGQLVINEIAKLDKLKKEGVISNVEYTRMREKTIKNYGKSKKA